LLLLFDFLAGLICRDVSVRVVDIDVKFRSRDILIHVVKD